MEAIYGVSSTDFLSVSSVGSEAMQPPRHPPDGWPTKRPFSILGRIGGDATGAVFSSRSPRPPLSVSSVGSEAMQRIAPAMAPATAVLSVSSVGSEAMQPRRQR